MGARRAIFSLAVLVVGSFLTATVVVAQQAPRATKLALLIGNKAYSAEVGPLKNPHNDTRIVAAALQAAGFEIAQTLRDATRAQTLLAVREFADRLAAAGPEAVGVFYYSGHGAALGPRNYLIPTDVMKPDAAALEDGGIAQKDIINRLLERAPNAAHYLVIDACRNNLGGSKGPKGFVPEDRRDGMLISFSTAPDRPASDEGENGGPFARVFAGELVKPATFDLLLFHNVRIAMDALSRGAQVPWVEDGIRRPQRPMLGAAGAVPLPPPLAPIAPPKSVATTKRSDASAFTSNDVASLARTKVHAGDFIMFSCRIGRRLDTNSEPGTSAFADALAHALANDVTMLDPSGLPARVTASMRQHRRSISPPEWRDVLQSPTRIGFTTRWVGLSIGVGGYLELPQLSSAAGDGDLVGENLTRRSVKTTTLRNPTEAQVHAGVNALADQTGPDASVVVYVTGHAVVLDGTNHFAAVDAEVPTKGDFATNRGWIDLGRMLDVIRAKQPKALIVFVDTCYDYPALAR